MTIDNIRVRIAPSPTGDPHVGTAYMALFNYCFARANGGSFILRIEDTDRQRSSKASEQAILESLKWLGLEWDEGPDVGGRFAPYRQAERVDIYAQYAQQLLDNDQAFKCYRSAEELDQLRQQLKADGYMGALQYSHLKLSERETLRREKNKRPYVIRLKVPEQGSCKIEDMLRDPIVFDWQQVDAQILLKSDAMPTYHLANVIDDHLMQISHVIRGEEWINSAPKHQLLYHYFGWQMPKLCHMPLLRNPDKSKLSKRKNPTSITYYKDLGYSAKALINYLGRMGFSMPDGSEKFDLNAMVNAFDIARISLGSPIFDMDKLNWLNGLWLREEGTASDILQQLKDWRINDEYLLKIIPLLRSRMNRLSDFMPLAEPFFNAMPDITKQSFDGLKLAFEQQIKVLQYCLWMLDNHRHWQPDSLYQELNWLAQKMDLKLKEFLQPLFIALSGSLVAPPLFDLMALIGADLTRNRLRFALQTLGGISKKQQKQLEKDYRALIT